MCIPFIGLAQTDYQLDFNASTLDYVIFCLSLYIRSLPLHNLKSFDPIFTIFFTTYSLGVEGVS